MFVFHFVQRESVLGGEKAWRGGGGGGEGNRGEKERKGRLEG